MARSPKWRRWLKWGGTAACLVILTTFLVSIRYVVFWNPGRQHQLVLIPGAAGACWWTSGSIPNGPYGMPGWYVFDAPDGPRWWFHYYADSRSHSFMVPLWIPFLLVGIPMAFLWWHDRRRVPPGHCQHCGYDLTGNASGVCPECGRAT